MSKMPSTNFVIPAQAGVQEAPNELDSRMRGNDSGAVVLPKIGALL